MSGPVDVLAVMVTLCSLGGTIGPIKVVPKYNLPRGTGTIASHMRPLKTAQVRRALERAEKAGDVVRCGTGAEHCRSWNKNAADEKELYWRVSDAALARVEGAK